MLRQRILRRGISSEKYIDEQYLNRLVDIYTRFFHDYDDAPLLIVNAAEIDPVNKEEDYQLLLRRILGVQSGRHYFNPLPMAM